jgi:hypothetical protein
MCQNTSNFYSQWCENVTSLTNIMCLVKFVVSDRKNLRIIWRLEVSLLIHEYPSPVSQVCEGTYGQVAGHLRPIHI